jgi:putative transposase
LARYARKAREERHRIARLCGKEGNFTGEHLWARGYAVSTVGFELEQVRQYIREQEEADGTGGQF